MGPYSAGQKTGYVTLSLLNYVIFCHCSFTETCVSQSQDEHRTGPGPVNGYPNKNPFQKRCAGTQVKKPYGNIMSMIFIQSV